MGTQEQPMWIETEQKNDEAALNDAQRRLQHQVEVQSRQIEQLLARNNVQAGVRGGSIRPHWVSFDLGSQLSGGLERLRRMTGDLANALGVPEVRVQRQDGRLRLAVRRHEPHPVDLLDLLDLVPESGDLSLALGLDHQGQPVMLDLAQRDLHNILVAGVSGAGKSSLIRSLAVSLALTCRQSLAQMAVISLGSEPSGITARPNPLYPINYLPHLLFPLAATLDEAVEALAYLVEEVAYRAEHDISSPALVIIVDDADMLLRRVGGVVAKHLAALLHAPAEAGVRVIAGASNPGLPDLYQMLRHNVDFRLVGRMADERSALAAAGREKSYAQYLDGKGDFLAISAAGVTPFQAAYIDDYDLHLTLYDGVNARVGTQPAGPSGQETIEIVVEPANEAGQDGGDLTWLDDAQGPERDLQTEPPVAMGRELSLTPEQHTVTTPANGDGEGDDSGDESAIATGGSGRRTYSPWLAPEPQAEATAFVEDDAQPEPAGPSADEAAADRPPEASRPTAVELEAEQSQEA
ncbi:MAG: FtsK/SpoIIIE domain-containing protein, partial [Planctomycetota bacterium]